MNSRDPQDKLRREVSRLYTTGGDPYNTADTVRISRQLALDFVEWLGCQPPGEMEQGGLMRRQAD
jgi:hypothetical protein